MVLLKRVTSLIVALLLFERTVANQTPQRYHLISRYLNWYDARAFCRVKYSDLATVNNMDDNHQLVQALKGHVTYSWIGLLKGGQRRWMLSDGSGGALFYRWIEGEPSGGEWCVELLEGDSWNDLSCGEEKGFVCYERQNGQDRFVYYSEARTWANSQDFCRSRHTDMANVNSEQDNTDIVNLIKTWHGAVVLENRVWIGLFSDAWMWSDGGLTSFRYWLSDKQYREDCALVSGHNQGRWVDAQCKQETTFVCQGDLKVKKMVMKMTVRSDANLTDATISDALLKQLETSLELQWVTDFSLGWRSDRYGFVFQLYKELEDDVATGLCCFLTLDRML
ncbi:macrophage mannose receptor 1-like [Xyrichtys novacula]|uniref:Macrophage mannose receptor 1-like n=1 Tax=Xyrichtys novacula TaxID=13765 RepID=A0AAV1HLH1_XYRNO|nr:macrophage mannose receptor 1-like [Xyrichtys novacula]